MNRAVVILCGGLGTRLRNIVSDRPKAMALINNRPFLEYQISWLRQQGVSEIVLAVGYKSEQIENYFLDGNNFGLKIKYSYEKTPLGTGGAILNAILQYKLKSSVVINGDSFIDIDLLEFEHFFVQNNADLCITSHLMNKADRYGVIETDNRNRFLGFSEKKIIDTPSWVNSGVYMLNTSIFKGLKLDTTFSFETEFLCNFTKKNSFIFKCCDKSFIDIGTPESFSEAKEFFVDFD